MNRRSFLRLLAIGAIAETVDVERLLWIPGQKTIFLPETIYHPSYSQILAIELERMIPRIKTLFERDTTFYSILAKGPCDISTRQFSIPINVIPRTVTKKLNM